MDNTVEKLIQLLDEKVKYDSSDPTAGYLSDKIVAGTGITLSEGTGADENKVKITNSLDLSAYLTSATAGTTYLKLDQTTPQTTVGTFTFPTAVVQTDFTTGQLDTTTLATATGGTNASGDIMSGYNFTPGNYTYKIYPYAAIANQKSYGLPLTIVATMPYGYINELGNMTRSATQIAEIISGDGFSGDFYGYLYVFGYKDNGGTRYYSEVPWDVGFTYDSGGADPYEIQLNWSEIPDCDGYYVYDGNNSVGEYIVGHANTTLTWNANSGASSDDPFSNGMGTNSVWYGEAIQLNWGAVAGADGYRVTVAGNWWGTEGLPPTEYLDVATNSLLDNLDGGVTWYNSSSIVTTPTGYYSGILTAYGKIKTHTVDFFTSPELTVGAVKYLAFDSVDQTGVALGKNATPRHSIISIGDSNGTLITDLDWGLNYARDAILIGSNNMPLAMNSATLTQCVAIGFNIGSLKSNGTGVSIGYNTGLYGATGVHIGKNAGAYSASGGGGSNVYVGINAGPQARTTNQDSYNIFVGNYGGQNLTTAYGNSVVGYQAGYQINSGYHNALHGTYSGVNITSGNTNAYYGHYSGGTATGYQNSAFGYYAGYSQSTGRAEGNMYQGYDLINTVAVGNFAVPYVNNTMTFGGHRWIGTPYKYGFGTNTTLYDMQLEGSMFIADSAGTLGAEKLTNPTFSSATSGWTMVANGTVAFNNSTTITGTSTLFTTQFSVGDTIILDPTGLNLTRVIQTITNNTSMTVSVATTGGSVTGKALWAYPNSKLPWQIATNLATHGVNGTTAIRQVSSMMVTPLVVGEIYTLSFGVSGITNQSGTIRVGCGGVTLLPVTSFNLNRDATMFQFTFEALTTDALEIIPSSLGRFSINNCSLKKVSSGGLTLAGSLTSKALTAGRVPFVGAGGVLQDDADMTFATDTLTVTKIAAHQVTGDLTFVGAGTGLPYGEIYIDNGTQTLLLTTSFQQIVNFDTEGTNGISNNMTPAVASNKLTITTAGVYRVSAKFSGLTTKVSPVYMAVFIDGVEQNNIESSATGVENGFITLSASGIVSIAANKDIDIRLKYITGADAPTVTLSHINLDAVQIGG